MQNLSFKPRFTFIEELKYLSKVDRQIILELKAAIDLLCSQQKLPKEYRDHNLQGSYQGYREFHLRDTPKGRRANAKNDVLVIYKVKRQELILVGVHIGSHRRLFKGKFRKNRKGKN